MADIGFYHVQSGSVETALTRLLLKAYAQQSRVVVQVSSADRVREIDSLLWTFDADSFLPHGTARSGELALQPIFITEVAQRPNDAAFLMVLENALPPDLEGYERLFYLFDGNDDAQVAAARAHWRSLQEAGGHVLAYWQQVDGRWIRKAQEGAA